MEEGGEAEISFAGVAQLVEQLIRNQQVTGSIPVSSLNEYVTYATEGSVSHSTNLIPRSVATRDLESNIDCFAPSGLAMT